MTDGGGGKCVTVVIGGVASNDIMSSCAVVCF